MKSSIAAPCFRNSGIADDAEGLRRLAGDHVPHFRRRAHRHGALVDDDGVLVEGLADRFRHREHMLQIGGAIVALRRADGNEDDVRRLDRCRQVRGEGEAILVLVAEHDFFEARLVNRHLAGLERRDFRGVLVDARDGVPIFGQARSQNEAHIA